MIPMRIVYNAITICCNSKGICLENRFSELLSCALASFVPMARNECKLSALLGYQPSVPAVRDQMLANPLPYSFSCSASQASFSSLRSVLSTR